MKRHVVDGLLLAALAALFLWFTFRPPAWFVAMVRR